MIFGDKIVKAWQNIMFLTFSLDINALCVCKNIISLFQGVFERIRAIYLGCILFTLREFQIFNHQKQKYR